VEKEGVVAGGWIKGIEAPAGAEEAPSAEEALLALERLQSMKASANKRAIVNCEGKEDSQIRQHTGSSCSCCAVIGSSSS
jgi:hypothetical protein